MSCPVCFFRDDTQRRLKEACFGKSRFEDKIQTYKQKFIEGIKGMGSMSDCECYKRYPYDNLVTWTDEFHECLIDDLGNIENTFDDISGFYSDYIIISQKVALENLWRYLEVNKLTDQAENNITAKGIFFRGRLPTWTEEKWGLA